MLLQKDKLYVLCSATKGMYRLAAPYGHRDSTSSLRIAKHLEQLRKHKTVVPVELLVQAKSKDPPTDALPRFVDAYTSLQRVGTLAKEVPTGKVVEEWKKALEASGKPIETVDISVGLSALMAVKDEEELVRCNYLCHVPILIHYPENRSDRGQFDVLPARQLRRDEVGDDHRP